MSEIPKITYSGIEILYSESRNVWLFTLNGRDRHADTLSNAKAAINKPTPQQKIPFKRFKALLRHPYFTTRWDEVEVTGLGESSCRGDARVWIVRGFNRERSLERLASLVADNDANRVTLSAITELNTTILGIEADREVLVKKLIKIVPPEHLV